LSIYAVDKGKRTQQGQERREEGAGETGRWFKGRDRLDMVVELKV